jgi:ABC-type Fe3+ transport system permease subunit
LNHSVVYLFVFVSLNDFARSSRLTFKQAIGFVVYPMSRKALVSRTEIVVKNGITSFMTPQPVSAKPAQFKFASRGRI